MKIKIEVDLTPDEVQELFIPGVKQKEFAGELYKAYVGAMAQTVTSTVKNTFFKGRKVSEFKKRPLDES